MTKNNFAMQEILKGDRVLQTNATRQLWARVGMSFYLTDAEYEKFCEFAEKETDELSIYIPELIKKGKAVLDGETYFPEESFYLTDAEYEKFCEFAEKETDELSIYIPELIKKGKAVLDGETYFPEDCNDNLDNHDIEVQLFDQMNFKADVVHNLIDAMSEYALESGWTDRDFMDALIGCGVTKEDFVQAGYKEFVEKYFEEDQKEEQETDTCEKQADAFKMEETSIVDEEHSTSEKYHEAKECYKEQADYPADFQKMIIELYLEHKEYAVKMKQLLDAYKYPTDKFFSDQAVNCLKSYTKIDSTVDGYAEIVDDIAYALYEEYNESEQSYDLTMKTIKEYSVLIDDNDDATVDGYAEIVDDIAYALYEEYNESEQSYDLTMKTIKEYSVLIDDNDDEEAFIESLKEKKNPLIELGDTQVTIATIVYRILSGEVKEYPVEEPMEITYSDAEKIEERFYSLKQRYIPLKELLEIAKNELN